MLKRIALHVAFWLSYLALKTYMGVFLMNTTWFNLDMETRIVKAFMPELIVLLPKLLMAYTIMYFIIPRMNKVRRWQVIAEVALLTIVSLSMYHVLLRNVLYPVFYKETPPDSTFSEGISRFIWRLLDMLAIVGTACTFKLLRKQVHDAEKEKQLVREKLQSELNFLRAQNQSSFFV
jgi:hypothetical protein